MKEITEKIKAIMKPIIILFMSFLLTSCNNGQKVNFSRNDKEIKNNSNIELFKNDDFSVFYSEFISDSLFQKEHIIFPLKDAVYECDSIVTLTKENWTFDSVDVRNYDKSLDNIIINQGKDKFKITLNRKEVGKLYEMIFKKIDGSWYLIYYFVNAC